MLSLRYGEFDVVVSNQAGHKPGSADNLRRFDRETCLTDNDYHLSSHHAVVVKQDENEIASHLLAADGGASGIHEHSALTHENRLFLAVGNQLCSLRIPTLDLIWTTQVDDATCFGVHLSRGRDFLISHGELEISRLDFDGNIQWKSSGADILTGRLEIFEEHVEAEDFNGWRYRIDVRTGKNKRLSST